MADRNGTVSTSVADDVAQDHDDYHYFTLLLHLVYHYYRIQNDSSFFVWLVIMTVVLSVQFVLQRLQQHLCYRQRLMSSADNDENVNVLFR